MYKDGVKQDD